MTNTALLEVSDLTVRYGDPQHSALAVDQVSFHVGVSDSLGIIGESGCGKSTTLYSICRLLPKNALISSSGLFYQGTDLEQLSDDSFRAIRWNQIAMIFQGAMNCLDPVKRVGSLLSEAYSTHNPRATRFQSRARALEVLELVRLPTRVFRSYSHELSGGMRQRVGIALSMTCSPTLLLADEPTTALDVVLQDEILSDLLILQREEHFSFILVTHDLSVASETCARIGVMYAGQLVEIGKARETLQQPSHPYTALLLRSFPSLDMDSSKLMSISGYPPALTEKRIGCRFYERCPLRTSDCAELDIPREAKKRGDKIVCLYPERTHSLWSDNLG